MSSNVREDNAQPERRTHPGDSFCLWHPVMGLIMIVLDAIASIWALKMSNYGFAFFVGILLMFMGGCYDCTQHNFRQWCCRNSANCAAFFLPLFLAYYFLLLSGVFISFQFTMTRNGPKKSEIFIKFIYFKDSIIGAFCLVEIIMTLFHFIAGWGALKSCCRQYCGCDEESGQDHLYLKEEEMSNYKFCCLDKPEPLSDQSSRFVVKNEQLEELDSSKLLNTKTEDCSINFDVIRSYAQYFEEKNQDVCRWMRLLLVVTIMFRLLDIFVSITHIGVHNEFIRENFSWITKSVQITLSSVLLGFSVISFGITFLAESYLFAQLDEDLFLFRLWIREENEEEYEKLKLRGGLNCCFQMCLLHRIRCLCFSCWNCVAIYKTCLFHRGNVKTKAYLNKNFKRMHSKLNAKEYNYLELMFVKFYKPRYTECCGFCRSLFAGLYEKIDELGINCALLSIDNIIILLTASMGADSIYHSVKPIAAPVSIVAACFSSANICLKLADQWDNVYSHPLIIRSFNRMTRSRLGFMQRL